MHDTNGNRPSGPRKRVRMDCAFGHLTVGPPHHGPGHEHRGDEGGLLPCATMGQERLQEVGPGAAAHQVSPPSQPLVTVRRRVRTVAVDAAVRP